MTFDVYTKQQKLFKAIAGGVGDHAGCNDGEEEQAKDWMNRFNSLNDGTEFDQFISEIRNRVAYG